MEKQYIAIDLKSFYASVECRERNLDPLTTNLVVADPSRTEKTICLAVSPALKSFGIPGRPRLFEVVDLVGRANAERRRKAPGHKFQGSSSNLLELQKNTSLSIDYIVAPPRMAYYIDYSAEIYKVYLKYVAPEDIHVYSIDEVFIDATPYLNLYKTNAHDFAMSMIQDVLKTTGITATAGIGTNLYLAKIAMDIVAKKMDPDENGVRIASLDEFSYRKQLWAHRPLKDFWRVGRGISKRLEANGIYTMGDIARVSCTESGEDYLYDLFGINAELLIDHAWGIEPVEISDIKAYKPSHHCLSSGQVLSHPYTNEKALLVVREMADLLSLDLVEKDLVTNHISLTIRYDVENCFTENPSTQSLRELTTDSYGRKVPKKAHGSKSLNQFTSSRNTLDAEIQKLFTAITDPTLLIRKITINADHVLPAEEAQKFGEQLSLLPAFSSNEKKAIIEKEKRRLETIVELRKRFGKNAVLRGMNLEEGATMKERNAQIGGHKA